MINLLTEELVNKILFETEEAAQQILDEAHPGVFRVYIEDSKGATSICTAQGEVMRLGYVIREMVLS